MATTHDTSVPETGFIPIIWTPFPPTKQTRPLHLNDLRDDSTAQSPPRQFGLYQKLGAEYLVASPSTPPKDMKYKSDRRGSESSTSGTQTTEPERTLVVPVQDIQLLPRSPPLKPLSAAQDHARWQHSLDYHELLCSISLDKACTTTPTHQPTGRVSHGVSVRLDELPTKRPPRKASSQTSIKPPHISNCLPVPPTQTFPAPSPRRKSSTASACSTCKSKNSPKSTCTHGSSRTAEEELRRLHRDEIIKPNRSGSEARPYQGSYFDHGSSKSMGEALFKDIGKRIWELKEKAAESRLRKIKSMEMEKRGFDQKIYSYWRA